jgi:hypothetical protein
MLEWKMLAQQKLNCSHTNALTQFLNSQVSTHTHTSSCDCQWLRQFEEEEEDEWMITEFFINRLREKKREFDQGK